MKSTIIYSFLLLLLCACTEKQMTTHSEYDLEGRRVLKASSLNMPIRIISIEDILLVKNDSRVNPVFETYDLNSEVKLNSFGMKGKGPGEIIYVSDFQYSQSLNKVFLHELVMNKILYLDNDDLYSSLPILKEYFDIELNGFFAHKFCYLDSCFIFQGVSKECERLQFHPIDSSHAYNAGSYNEDLLSGNSNTISKYRRLLSINGNIEANSQLKRIVSTYNYSDLIEIFDVTGDSIVGSSEIHNPILRSFSGNSPNDVAKISRAAIIGYDDICIANDLIYCLISYKTVDDVVKSGTRCHSNFIHVFDWDANLIATLKLNIPVHCIAYNEYRNTILGIRNTPEPEVFEFENPEI